MRALTFAKRCTKEILRDPLNLAFGLGFPIVLLLLLSAIQSNIPVDLFRIEALTPGITVFGLSFMTLFSATLIARDRESSFLQRLYTSPLKSFDFILGYMLPLIPISLAQSTVCYLVALTLGMTPSVNIFYAIIANFPAAVFHISLGLLCGSVFNVKQVGGICGALLTNLCGWFSGVWFDITLVGGVFLKIARILPFIHAVSLEQAVVSGNFTGILPRLCTVLAYALVTTVLAILLFLRQTKKQ